MRARGSTTGRLPFRFRVRFAIDFAIVVLIVDHRSRLLKLIVILSSFVRPRFLFGKSTNLTRAKGTQIERK
jgi:hypothetical protein